MLISEIFKSIDGESLRTGELSTFVRGIGCPLRCKYCDSQYTWQKEDSSKEMSVQEIVDKCLELDCTNITFTGGEPLIQKDADELITSLAESGFDVSIETCGAVDFTNREWFLRNNPNVWVCADYKCYESGMNNKMLSLEKFAQLRDRDVLKFVVGSEKDLDLARSIITYLRENNCNCYCYLSPVFGMIKPVDIVDYMLKNNLNNKVRFQVQLHKIVWDPNMRGV